MKKKYILQFYPEKYDYLTHVKKIEYNGKYLKTAYLIDLIHYFISKSFLFGKKEFNLWSPLLQKKYGMNYKLYLKWLMDENIIEVSSKWFAGKKAITYKMLLDFNNETIKRYKNYDPFLLKKLKNRIILEKYNGVDEKLLKLREKIIEDLFHVNLDYDNAIKKLSNEYEISLIDKMSYDKNYMTLESIKHRQIYWNFDKFGRLHTNFTILKKNIRNNYLTIDNQKIKEVDIPNSQPYFLSLLLNDILSDEDKQTNEYNEFILRIKNSTFYESFDYLDVPRKEKKELVYKVFFDVNNMNEKRNRIFRNRWPLLWKWIKKWKESQNNYAALAWELQRRESNLIFNNICNDIKEEHPYIKIFTVHDSVFYPAKYDTIVKKIFNNYLPHLNLV